MPAIVSMMYTVKSTEYLSLKCVPPIHSPPLIELAFAKFCKLSYSFILTELGNVAE